MSMKSLHVGVGSAFRFKGGGRAMTGIYLIIPGKSRELFQGFFDIIPIAGGEICSATGALEQGIAAENDILADEADGACRMPGGFHDVEFHIPDSYLIPFGNQNIGMNDDGAADKLGTVEGRVGKDRHFLCCADDFTAEMLCNLIDRADMVIMPVGEQDMCNLEVVLFYIMI